SFNSSARKTVAPESELNPSPALSGAVSAGTSPYPHCHAPFTSFLIAGRRCLRLKCEDAPALLGDGTARCRTPFGVDGRVVRDVQMIDAVREPRISGQQIRRWQCHRQ